MDMGNCNSDIEESGLADQNRPHFFQCGYAPAYVDPNDVKPGCMRVIRATPLEMASGGRI